MGTGLLINSHHRVPCLVKSHKSHSLHWIYIVNQSGVKCSCFNCTSVLHVKYQMLSCRGAEFISLNKRVKFAPELELGHILTHNHPLSTGFIWQPTAINIGLVTHPPTMYWITETVHKIPEYFYECFHSELLGHNQLIIRDGEEFNQSYKCVFFFKIIPNCFS